MKLAHNVERHQRIIRKVIALGERASLTVRLRTISKLSLLKYNYASDRASKPTYDNIAQRYLKKSK